jgi:hypothetical protein
MQEVDWRMLGRRELVHLIVEHNASVHPLPDELKRRIRRRLAAMNVEELWKHVEDVYGGVLMGPEPPVKRPRGHQRGAHSFRGVSEGLARVPERHIDIPVIEKEEVYTMRDAAESWLWWRPEVYRVECIGDDTLVAWVQTAIQRALLRKAWNKQQYFTGVHLFIPKEEDDNK